MHQRGTLLKTQVEWSRLLIRKRDLNRSRELLSEIEDEHPREHGEMAIAIGAAKAAQALADGDPDKAHAIALEALEKAETLGFVVYWVDLKILESRALSCMKERAAAYMCMSEALERGARFGLRVPFLREKDEIFDLLNEAMSERKLKRSARRFCESLLPEMEFKKDEPAMPADSAKPLPLQRDLLTRRERQVLTLLNKGMSRKEIAEELSIAYNTVKAHISHIYEKLGVDNKLDAFHAARRPRGM